VAMGTWRKIDTRGLAKGKDMTGLPEAAIGTGDLAHSTGKPERGETCRDTRVFRIMLVAG